MNKNTGGPAFPKQPHRLANGTLEGNNEGMTLRDHLAGLAMQAMLTVCCNTREFPIAAQAAYRMADAMLAEREKGDE